MARRMSTLSLRGVGLRRGGRLIVSGVTFDAHPGDLVVMQGPSGSGKTSILRAIAALDPLEEGTIDVGPARLQAARTADRETLRALRRSVGLVFQFHCLFAHLSALQNVCLAPVHVQGAPRHDAEATAMSLLTQLGVGERARAWPRELSGGEAQRVAIARALAVDPPLLLMDEPMASLDPSRKSELGSLLQRLTATGRTLVVTTHDDRFASEFATRVLRIDAGMVVEEQ
jgi:ABC-type polar amino acid transport system ATPase subunit